MLEIFCLIALGKKIAANARAKDWSGGAAVVVLVALWFGGEIAGAIAGVVGLMILNPADEPNLLVLIACGIAGAAVGAAVAFAVVALLPTPQYEEFEEYEEYEEYR